jgi:FKBP-type peptidyl-prolyl cis-trans isomerase
MKTILILGLFISSAMSCVEGQTNGIADGNATVHAVSSKSNKTATSTSANSPETLKKEAVNPEQLQSDQLQKDIKILEEYLATQGITDFKRTDSGLIYVVEKQGDGAKVNPGETVSVHYTGRTLDGNKFDSSLDRGQPLSFPIGKGQVIQAWDQGIPLFNVGGKGTLYAPSPLAYAERGFPGAIEPNTPLIFDIEVVDSYDPTARAKEAAALNFAEIEAYAKANKLDTRKTESGLYYVILSEGEGEKAQEGQTVSVDYTGTFLDGSEFDSSRDRGPYTFQLGKGKVIKGWDEGLQLLSKGGKAKLLVPSTLGYGSHDRGPIKANSVLLFDVELVDIK